MTPRPLFMYLGDSLEALFESLLRDISPSNWTRPVAICTDTVNDGPSTALARMLHDRMVARTDHVANRSGEFRSVQIAVPSHSDRQLFPWRGTGFQLLQTDRPDAERGEVSLRSDVANAASLVGIATTPIKAAAVLGPLAIGGWTRFAGPAIALPLLYPSRREARTADVAAVLGRLIRVSMLVTRAQGYVVLIASPDLVACELGGLAIVSWTLDSDPGRTLPWEDKVVQRAYELDLGASTPDQIDLRPRLAMPHATVGDTERFADLVVSVRGLLSLPTIA